MKTLRSSVGTAAINSATFGTPAAFPLAVARHQMLRFFGAYSFGFFPAKDQVVLPKHART